MLVETKFHDHMRGCRDPFWLNDMYQMPFWLCLFSYPFAVIWGREEEDVTSQWCLVAVLALLVALIVWPGVWRLRDRSVAFSQGKTTVNGSKDSSAEIVGSAAQIKRVVSTLHCVAQGERCFRTGPADEEYVSFALVFIAAFCTKVWFEVSAAAVVTFCFGATAVICLRVCLARNRFRVGNGSLIVESMRWWRVIHVKEVDLSGVDVRVDLCNGTVDVGGSAGPLRIDLWKLYYPHRFVASLLKNAAFSSSEQSLRLQSDCSR